MNSQERWNYAKHHYNADEVDWDKMPRGILIMAWFKLLILHPVLTIKETIKASR
mgnify:FL=1